MMGARAHADAYQQQGGWGGTRASWRQRASSHRAAASWVGVCRLGARHGDVERVGRKHAPERLSCRADHLDVHEPLQRDGARAVAGNALDVIQAVVEGQILEGGARCKRERARCARRRMGFLDAPAAVATAPRRPRVRTLRPRRRGHHLALEVHRVWSNRLAGAKAGQRGTGTGHYAKQATPFAPVSGAPPHRRSQALPQPPCRHIHRRPAQKIGRARAAMMRPVLLCNTQRRARRSCQRRRRAREATGHAQERRVDRNRGGRRAQPHPPPTGNRKTTPATT